MYISEGASGAEEGPILSEEAVPGISAPLVRLSCEEGAHNKGVADAESAMVIDVLKLPEIGLGQRLEGLGGRPAMMVGCFSRSALTNGLAVFLALDRLIIRQARTTIRASRARPPTAPPTTAATGKERVELEPSMVGALLPAEAEPVPPPAAVEPAVTD
jgi:hypothetical protein